MNTFGRCMSVSVVVLGMFGFQSLAEAQTWDGGGADDLLTTDANWNPDADYAGGGHLIFTGNVRLTPNTGTDPLLSPRTITFDANADAFTFGGTTELVINNAGSGAPNTSANNSSFTQTFNVDVGMRRVTLNANTGDFVFNNPVRLFTTTTTFTGAKDIYLNAGLRETAGATRQGTGTLFIPVESTNWSGNMAIGNGNVEVGHGGALGVAAPQSNYTQILRNTATGSLVLTNNIDVGEYIYIDQRNGYNAHIKNKSGDNTISGTIELERGTLGASEAGVRFFAIQSDGVGVSDILRITGSIVSAPGENLNHDGGAFLALQGAGNGIISGNISEQGGNATSIVKRDGGTWTLTGTNSHQGATTIEAGTLSLGATGSISNTTGIEVKSGAFLVTSGLSGGGLSLVGSQSLKGAGTVTGSILAGSGNVIIPGDSVGTLTLTGDLTLSGGSTLQYELSNNPLGSNDKIAVGGTVAVSGTTAVSVTAVNGSLGSGSYRLIDYTGTAISDPNSAFTLTGGVLSPRQTALFSSIANQLNLDVTGNAGNLTWVGGLNSNAWDVNTTVNWTGEADSHFFDADIVTFSDTGSNSPDVNIAGTVAPGQVNFTNNAGHDYNLTGGNLNVAGDLTASGSGNVTFSNSDLSVAGTFTQNGTGTITLANTGALALPSTVALNSGTLALNFAGDRTLTSGLTGAGSLRKDGSNTVILSGDNSSFSGQIVVSSGILKAHGNNTLGAGSTIASGVVVHDGATLDVVNGTTTAGTGTEVVAISGTGTDGRGALVVAQAANSNAHINQIVLDADSKIGAYGTGATAAGRSILWIDGPGASIQGNGHNLSVVIDVAGNISNGTEVNWLDVGNTNLNNIDISGGGVLYIGGSTTFGPTTGTLTLKDSGRLGLYGSTGVDVTNVIDKPIVVEASANGGGIESYLHTGPSKTVSSSITLNANLDLTMVQSSSTSAANNAIFNDTTNSVTLSGPITGTGSLSAHLVAGAQATRLGRLELTSDGNNYGGTTTVGGGGGMQTANAANDRITLSVGNGGGTGSLGTGDVIVNGGSGVATATLQFNRIGTFAVANNISGGGNVTQVAAGGTPTLTGALSYTGDTIVTAGTLDISSSHTTGNAYSVAAGAALITTNLRANTLTVDGNATVRADGGTNGASKVETLALTGQLNLTNNDLVIGSGADLLAVRSQIKLGLSGVDNTAAAVGITSDMMTLGVHGFGYALGNDPNLSSLLTDSGQLTGQAFDADSVLVKYTYRGDADLDGDADLVDLSRWAESFSGSLANPEIPTTLWTQGDWDYDGDTDLVDLSLWSANFTGNLNGGGLSVYAPNASAGAISALAGMGITVVPEPGSVSLLLLGFGGLLLRRVGRGRRHFAHPST